MTLINAVQFSSLVVISGPFEFGLISLNKLISHLIKSVTGTICTRTHTLHLVDGCGIENYLLAYLNGNSLFILGPAKH